MRFKILKLLCFICVCNLISCEEIIAVENISNAHVNLLAPSDSIVLNEENITLTWDPIEDAELYKLQIATPSFKEAKQIVEDTIISVTYFSVELDTLSYQWRVMAKNSAYETVYSTQNFSIEY